MDEVLPRVIAALLIALIGLTFALTPFLLVYRWWLNKERETTGPVLVLGMVTATWAFVSGVISIQLALDTLGLAL